MSLYKLFLNLQTKFSLPLTTKPSGFPPSHCEGRLFLDQVGQFLNLNLLQNQVQL